jgi:DNA-binding transcriptional LysR family regulator
MKYNQLEAYRAVMLTGSVTEAAAYLHVSQPGISRLLGDLERSLGFKLFDRHPGRLVPTPEGKIFYAQVQRSFEGIQALEGVAKEIATLKLHNLRVATFPAGALTVIPDAIARMHSKYPDLSISVQMQSSLKVLDMVSTLQAEVGLVIAPLNFPGIRHETVFEDDCVCALPKKHVLTKAKAIQPSDLVRKHFLAVSENLYIGQELTELLRKQHVELKPVIEASSSYTICALAVRGVGVGIVDPLTVSAFQPNQLSIRKFEPPIKVKFAIVVSEHAVRSVATANFIGLLKTVVSETLGQVKSRL